jgi:hypothetical protein
MARTLFAAVAALVAAPAVAAPPTEEQDLVQKVNRSISRGVQFLYQEEGGKGNWETAVGEFSGMKGGFTALATLALLYCGEKPDEKPIARALDFLRSIPPSKTYVVGLTTMALAEAKQKRDLPRIQENVDWLVHNAMRKGNRLWGWSYPGNSLPDGSNTQYALLGLYAGKTAGAKVDDATWKEIREMYLSTMRSESETVGAWAYMPDIGAGNVGNSFGLPSFTMTVAGVCGLQIARMAMTESEQKLNPNTGVAAKCGVYESNVPINKGMNYIAREFNFDKVPGMKATFYNVYGIERLGRLTGQRYIGTKDWYWRGCEWLLARQGKDGDWGENTLHYDKYKSLSTSFALLFLSKGRTPVLLSKLAYGAHTMDPSGVIVEQTQKGDTAGVVGWNRKQNDTRNLTEFASRELFHGTPLAWQVYDPRRGDFSTPDLMTKEVGVLVQSPVLYLTGHHRPFLTGQQKELVKRYVEEGGFVIGEACCGHAEFADGFEKLMAELFPENKFEPLKAEHPIWRAYFDVSPADYPKLKGLDRGCRTVAVLSPQPLSGYWEEAKYMPEAGKPAANNGERAFRLGANLIAYATGMELPKQRLSTRKVTDPNRVDRTPPKGFLQPAQLKLGEAPPAQGAMRNLMDFVKTAARIDVTTRTEFIDAGDENLLKYKFLYAHGRKAFEMNADELAVLKMTLDTGGLLLADAACGSAAFDKAFRTFADKLYPGKKLEAVPVDDVLYSEKLNGTAIKTVRRREKAGGAGADGGFQELPPALEGIKVDGRWVVLYSKYDLGCALEGNKSTECLAHDRDSALRLGTAAVLYSLKR